MDMNRQYRVFFAIRTVVALRDDSRRELNDTGALLSTGSRVLSRSSQSTPGTQPYKCSALIFEAKRWVAKR